MTATDWQFAATTAMFTLLVILITWTARSLLHLNNENIRRDDRVSALQRHDQAHTEQITMLTTKLADSFGKLTDLYGELSERQARMDERLSMISMSMWNRDDKQ